MSPKEEEGARFTILRQRAEEALKGQPVELGDLSPDDVQYLLHELQVHQAELYLQNEELRRIQTALEISRDQYSDLYNFAPSGYCTINRKDRILEANQTLAVLLGKDQEKLVNEHFSHFIVREDQDKFYLHRQGAFEKRQPRASEVRLVKQTGERIYVRIESRVAHADADQLLIMVIDITKERHLQRRLIEQREQQRQKIAQDLHDGPVQALSAINFALRSLLMDHPHCEFAQSVEAIQASVREQIQQLRNYAVDLRPPILSQLGLEKGLHSYLETFREKYPDLAVRIEIHPIGMHLSESEGVALFRICQEALTNVSKHAGTKNIEVRVKLKKDGQLVRLDIQDNGPGFDLPDQWLDFAEAGHLGILGMRERAEAIGGQLAIQSSPGKGTHIMVSVPLNGFSPDKNTIP